MNIKELYNQNFNGVAYIESRNDNGDYSIGTCFHIGDGVFITAAHVVKNKKIIRIGTAPNGMDSQIETNNPEQKGSNSIKGPFFHPDSTVDIAALIIENVDLPALKLGGHLDDWLDYYFLLEECLILGYPLIPFSRGPYLVAARAEINAMIDKYTGGHPHFVLSAMARGGFSGGPAIMSSGDVLGVITESLGHGFKEPELGYMAVLTIEPIFVCLNHHGIVPKSVDIEWDGFWNTTSTYFTDEKHTVIATVAKYEGHKGKHLEISIDDPILYNKTVNELLEPLKGSKIEVTEVRQGMLSIMFLDEIQSAEMIIKLYDLVSDAIETSGLHPIPKK